MAGYSTVEDIANEKDMPSSATPRAWASRRPRQIKSAAENYLLEEAKLRAELNAERGHAAADRPAGPAGQRLAGRRRRRPRRR